MDKDSCDWDDFWHQPSDHDRDDNLVMDEFHFSDEEQVEKMKARKPTKKQKDTAGVAQVRRSMHESFANRQLADT